LLPSSTFRPGARPSLLSFGSTPGSLAASVGEAARLEDFLVRVSMSSAETVETGLTTVEVAIFFYVARLLLERLLFFFVGVAVDDDLVITGWP
jgi:hypothetical protein